MMERLKRSFFRARREQREEGSNGDDTRVSDPCDSEPRSFGLFVLYPSSSNAAPTRSNINVEYTYRKFVIKELI